MAVTRFDLEGLFRSIESERERRGVSLASVAREVRVAPSTIRRFGRADDAEADGVLALVRWLGAAPEEFVNGDLVTGERLRPAGDGFVRVDLELVARANGEPRGASGRTRTSIQHLVEVAQRSGRSIASLTRFSDV